MRKALPLLLIICFFLLFSCSSHDESDDDRLEIIAASFPSYDAARAVAGDLASVTMLVPSASASVTVICGCMSVGNPG